jgi:fucose 4-O-acetylase-like acetyltransferase
LVVVGHVIQYGSHNRFDFFVDPLFATIYSFHMPFFMFLSGFMAYKSTGSRPPRQLVTSRVRSLLVPFLAWAILGTLAMTAVVTVLGGSSLDLPTLGGGIARALLYPESSLWFLWVLFLCYVALALSGLVPAKGRWVALVTIVIAVYGLPLDELLGITQLKWLLPFFVIGYAIHPWQYKLARFRIQGTAAATLLFVLLRLAWVRTDSVYLNRMRPELDLLATGAAYGYRYLLALTGSIALIGIVSTMSPHFNLLILRELGKKSLGVYAFQTYFVLLLPRLPSPSGWDYSVLYVPIVSLGVLASSWLGTILLERWGPTRVVLLGGR